MGGQGKTRYEIFAAARGLFARFYPPADILEPIVQRGAALMGRQGWKKCAFKGGKKPKPWELGGQESQGA